MKIIEYDPSCTFSEILDGFGSSVTGSSDIYIFPDIPVIRQIEDRYSEIGVWSDKLYTLAKLSAAANIASGDMYNHISRLGRLMLMEEVINELGSRIDFLRDYTNVKGFSDSLLNLLAEIKHMGMDSDSIDSIASRIKTDSLALKLGEISLIFDAYQKKLTSVNMADDIDQLHSLSKYLRSERLRELLDGVGRIIVYGFYDFTDSQIDVLDSFDECVDELLILIPGFNDLDRLRDRVGSKLSKRKKQKNPEIIIRTETSEPEKILNSYPTVNYEFDGVFKEIKRLVIEDNYVPGDIALIFRSVGKSATRIVNTAEKYGIPVRIDDSFNLRTSIYGYFVTDLLGLVTTNYRRDKLLSFLKNPLTALYMGSDYYHHDLESIEKLSADRYKTLHGLKNWKHFLGEVEGKSKGVSSETVSALNGLLDVVSTGSGSTYASGITGFICSVLDFIDVQELSRKLVRDGHTTANCWDAFNSFIRELRFMSHRFDRKFSGPGEFLTFINGLMTEKHYSFTTDTGTGAVQVLDGLKVRGVSYPVIFLVNMDEGSFPSPYSGDPILKVYEKKEINDTEGRVLFAEDHIHYEKEEHLFNIICKSATEKLFVSYSRLDDNYIEKNRSYLIDSAGFGKINEFGFMESVSSAPYFSVPDLLSSFFYNGDHSGTSEVRRYVEENFGADLVSCIYSGLVAERSRSEMSGSYSDREGVLKDPGNIEKQYFRPTELEQYGACPFQYFAEEILGLEEEKTVDDRIEPLDIGRLYHEILRDLFSDKLIDYLTYENIKNLTTDIALEKYEELKSQNAYDVYFSHLSEQVRDIERKRVIEYTLPSFIEKEVERTKETGFVPFLFEYDVDFQSGDHSIHGKIDRCDSDRDGNVLVYDYKTGSVDYRKYYDYQNLQLPLYLLALKDQGYKPLGGYYLSVSKGDANGKQGEDKLMLGETGSRVSSYTANIMNGFFPPLIKDKDIQFESVESLLEYDFGMGGTCRYCGYSDLCRVKNGVKRIIKRENE